MASLNMEGPYPLTDTDVDDQVSQYFPGNDVLGHSEANTFIVQYVGRSDVYLNTILKKWLSGKYKDFQFSYADSPQSAFDTECRNYHDFGGKENLDNVIHPQKKMGFTWQCPVCSQ